MQFSHFNRDEFASIISGRKSRHDISVRTRAIVDDLEPPPGYVTPRWRNEELMECEPPVLVVVHDPEINDFLAWAVTFLPALRPLTAFMRVIPWSIYSEVRTARPTTVGGISSILAGAILGEAMMNSTGRGFLETLPLTAFESTYTATVGRALLSGFRGSLMQRASDGWHSARRLTGQPLRRVVPEALRDVWSVIEGLADLPSSHSSRSFHLETILDACKGIRAEGRIPSFVWRQLSSGGMLLSPYEEAMSASKEARVEAFEGAMERLRTGTPDPLLGGFVAGYLASLVSGGSIEHSQLVLPLQDRFPGVMLWYGVCAGMQPNSPLLMDYSGLGLRLVQGMSREETLLSPPNCDVSVEELEVLFRGDPRARGFRQANASFLRVEVAPTVSTVVKWPLRSSSGGQPANQIGLFAGEERHPTPEPERLRDLVFALRNSLSIAEALLTGQPARPEHTESQTRPKRRR
jgi:hypothetical protein